MNSELTRPPSNLKKYILDELDIIDVLFVCSNRTCVCLLCEVAWPSQTTCRNISVQSGSCSRESVAPRQSCDRPAAISQQGSPAATSSWCSSRFRGFSWEREIPENICRKGS